MSVVSNDSDQDTQTLSRLTVGDTHNYGYYKNRSEIVWPILLKYLLKKLRPTKLWCRWWHTSDVNFALICKMLFDKIYIFWTLHHSVFCLQIVDSYVLYIVTSWPSLAVMQHLTFFFFCLRLVPPFIVLSHKYHSEPLSVLCALWNRSSYITPSMYRVTLPLASVSQGKSFRSAKHYILKLNDYKSVGKG